MSWIYLTHCVWPTVYMTENKDQLKQKYVDCPNKHLHYINTGHTHAFISLLLAGVTHPCIWNSMQREDKQKARHHGIFGVDTLWDQEKIHTTNHLIYRQIPKYSLQPWRCSSTLITSLPLCLCCYFHSPIFFPFPLLEIVCCIQLVFKCSPLDVNSLPLLYLFEHQPHLYLQPNPFK